MTLRNLDFPNLNDKPQQIRQTLAKGAWKKNPTEWQTQFDKANDDIKLEMINDALNHNQTGALDCLFNEKPTNATEILNGRHNRFVQSLLARFVRYYEQNDPLLEDFMKLYPNSEYGQSNRFTEGVETYGPRPHYQSSNWGLFRTPFSAALGFAQFLSRIKNEETITPAEAKQCLENHFLRLYDDEDIACDAILPTIMKLDDVSICTVICDRFKDYIYESLRKYYLPLAAQMNAENIFKMLCLRYQDILKHEHNLFPGSMKKIKEIMDINQKLGAYLLSNLYGPPVTSSSELRVFKTRLPNGKIVRAALLENVESLSDDEVWEPPTQKMK